MANSFIGFNEQKSVRLVAKNYSLCEALRKTSDFDEIGMSFAQNATYDMDLNCHNNGRSSVIISEYDRASIYPDNQTFDIDKISHLIFWDVYGRTIEFLE